MISQKLGAYIDEDRTVRIKCKYCSADITFSYNSVGKTGRKLPCNLDGTMHRCAQYRRKF